MTSVTVCHGRIDGAPEGTPACEGTIVLSMRPRKGADVVSGSPAPIRRVAIGIASAVVCIAVAVGAVELWLGRGGSPQTPSRCWVAAGARKDFVVDPEQAANATTITAVGKQLGMPDHAVTIALATALQESQLRNLRYGDRDSLGLFQQRPSQGWGTRAQLLDPRFAATAFFTALARVPDWQGRAVTSAAQAVQRSGAPEAYATWVPLARALAVAMTGEVPAGLTCRYAVGRSQLGAPTLQPAITRLFGPRALGVPVSQARGWTIAAWLVAHAEAYKLTSVRFAAREWTPRGAWTATAANDGVQVTQSSASG